MKKETITIQVDYEIEYKTEEGKQEAITSIMKSLSSSGIHGGGYGVERLDETGRVVEAPNA